MCSEQLRDLICRVLTDSVMYSVEAQELLLMTAAVESNLGHYIRQVKGPALGIFQVEPKTELDIIRNYVDYRKPLKIMLGKRMIHGFADDALYPLLETDLVYQILMARIHYLRVPEALPKASWLYFGEDNKKPHPLWIEDMANYYKTFWNTKLGKATPEKAIKAYERYCT